jgi:hypothetical protein
MREARKQGRTRAAVKKDARISFLPFTDASFPNIGSIVIAVASVKEGDLRRVVWEQSGAGKNSLKMTSPAILRNLTQDN